MKRVTTNHEISGFFVFGFYFSFLDLMLEKLQKIISKYEDLREQALQPEVFQNPEKAKVINKELAGLETSYLIAQRYKKALAALASAEEMLKTETDPEMIAMAQEELDQAKKERDQADQELTIALLPKDPNDDKNIYLEIRPAAGGEESALFGAELLKMYLVYAQKMGRKPEIVEEQLTDI